jgi:hypothetical protein
VQSRRGGFARSEAGDFLLDVKLLPFDLLDHLIVGRRTGLFLAQAGLEPGVPGTKRFDMR